MAAERLVSVPTGKASAGFVSWLGRAVNTVPRFASIARVLCRLAKVMGEHGERFFEGIEDFCNSEAAKLAASAASRTTTEAPAIELTPTPEDSQ